MNNPIPLIKALTKPNPAEIESAVAGWLDEHPEATTTVENGSITRAKLATALQTSIDAIPANKNASDIEQYVLSNKILPDSAFARGNVNASGVPDGTGTNARVCTARPLTFPTDAVLDFGAAYSYFYNTSTKTVLRSWQQGKIEIPAGTSFAFVTTLNVSSTAETSTEDILAEFSISFPSNSRIDAGSCAYDSLKKLTDYNEFLNADNFKRGTGAIADNEIDSIVIGTYNAASRITSIPMIAPFDLYIKYPHDIYIFLISDDVASASGWVSGEQIIPKDTVFSVMLTPNKNANTPATTDEILAELDVTTAFDFHNSNEWAGGLQTICRIGYDVDNPDTPPEMSIKSFKDAYLHGYRIMLCDCVWTSDHVPVALHDDTINRVARNADGSSLSETVRPGEKTYAELAAYDYGLFKGDKWKGTPLLTVENFVRFCKAVGCEFYLELRPANLSAEDAKSLCDILKKLGMADRCTFVVETASVIQSLKAQLSTFRAGIVTGSPYTDEVNLERLTNALAQKTDSIQLFTYYYSAQPSTAIIPQTVLDYCIANGIPMEYTEIKSDAEFAAFLNNPRAEYCTRIAARPLPLLRKMFNAF